MITKTCFLSLALAASMMCAKAQVAIGGQGAPNPNAVLDLQTTDKGLLLPRVALINIYKADPLEEHVAGMIVYNTATDDDIEPGLYYNDGSKWKLIRSVAKRVEIAGMTFMDRNLGADPDAESVPSIYDPGTNTDPTGKLNGDYYQWGRVADGHQRWNSAAVDGPIAEEDDNGQIPEGTNAYGKFISSSDIGINNNDWKENRNDNLWDADGGKANPCPEGYRIPTEAEWQKVIDLKELAWSNAAKGFIIAGMNFFLPAAGARISDGRFSNVGVFGYYWSATAITTPTPRTAIGLFLNKDDYVNEYPPSPFVKHGRGSGLSVRCLKK